MDSFASADFRSSSCFLSLELWTQVSRRGEEEVEAEILHHSQRGGKEGGEEAAGGVVYYSLHPG